MFYTITKFLKSPYASRLEPREREELRLLTRIFPFKVSRYVLDELINWSDYKSDPIYRLTFPTKGMLTVEHWQYLKNANSTDQLKTRIRHIHGQLNPHPAGQQDNIPRIGNRVFEGIQHKYKETVLFFPAQGQTCHSYCTYCFRWAQFVQSTEHKFKSRDLQNLYDYLSAKKEVTDILFTGGDPMFMTNQTLFSYLNVILHHDLKHVSNIRIGTKALSFYPMRFLGETGDNLLKKFNTMIRRGKNITVMAHFSHPRELQTSTVSEAVKRLRDAGVIIRTQAPLIKGINADPVVWRTMWNKQVKMGMVPYYMFIERDTGAHHYFSVPLARAFEIFTNAYSKVSGLAKTVRGPSMSTHPGKVMINGIVTIDGDRYFSLKFIQARHPEIINKPFFARYDEKATWLDDLQIEPKMDFLSDECLGYDEASEVA